jgi:glutamyl-tRNA reductase
MALALAEGVLGDLREQRVLVVGAGRIALQTLKAARGRGVTDAAVANRTRERAEEAAASFEAQSFGTQSFGLTELESALAWADVVVSATSSEAPVVSTEVVHAAMSGRDDRALVLVDLAVPADVERSAGTIPGVRLFDVDDLRAGLDDAIGSRLREVPSVEAIVEDEVEGFERRYRELEVEPLVASIRRQAEEIRRREVDKTLRDLGDVDPETAERIEHFSRALVKKLLHGPTVRLRARAGAGEADEAAAAIRELFDLSAPRDP